MTADEPQIEQSFEGLRRQLREGTVLERVAAAERLGALGEGRAVPELMGTVLQDADLRVCQAAADALGKLGNAHAVKALIYLLRRDDVKGGSEEAAGVVQAALGALAKLREPALRTLLQAQQEYTDDEPIGGPAELTLARLHDPGIRDAVIATLYGRNRDVITAAVTVLHFLYGEAAIVPLVAVLRPETSIALPPDLRREITLATSYAADALGWIGEPAVPWLLDALRFGEEAYTREWAALALGRIGDERAIGPLRQALGDEDTYVRHLAAASLAKLHDAVGADVLIGGLSLPQQLDRSAAMSALIELGVLAVPALLRALADPTLDARVRAEVASILGQIHDLSVAEPLIATLSDTDARVRAAAAETLGELGAGQRTDASMVEPLIAALDDTDHNVQTSAAWALGCLGDQRAVVPLQAILREAEPAESLPYILALINFDDPSALEALHHLALDPEMPAGKRTTAIRGLHGHTDEQSLGVLRSVLLEGTHSISFYALPALASVGELAVPILVDALRDDRPPTRVMVMHWLTNMGIESIREQLREQATDTLIEALADPACQVRGAAARVLLRIGDARAIEPLIDALNDPHWHVRVSAAQALGELGDERAIAPLRRVYEESAINSQAPRESRHVFPWAIKQIQRRQPPPSEELPHHV